MTGEAHRRRRLENDSSLAAFIETYDLSIESKICSTGVRNMRETVRDKKEHTDGFALGQSVAVNVQTVPISQGQAIDWYRAEFGGLLGYVRSVVAPAIASRGFQALVHVVFGQDVQKADWQLWTSVAVMNFANPKVVSNFLPSPLLTREELKLTNEQR
jgi:hypothetical protein